MVSKRINERARGRANEGASALVRSCPRDPARGFVLVDAIVATVLLGVALAFLLGLSARSLRTQRQGENLEAAAMLLDEQLSLVLARGADGYAKTFGTKGSCEAPFERFNYELSVTGGSGSDAYLVTATISWSEDGATKQESVQTRIAPRRGDEPNPERKPQEAVTRE